MSHPQALNKEQMLELMGEAIPAIARRLKQDEGWAFLMKQANRVKELETENASLKAEVERLTKAGEWIIQSVHDEEWKETARAIKAWNAAKEVQS